MASADRASEDEANAARRAHGRELLAKGAHAVGVEDGKDGWVVVAHVAPSAKVTMPASLPASRGSGDVKVPLVVRHSEPYAPE